MSLSGTPTQRISSGLPSTTGLLCDWSSLILPIADRVEVIINRVTKPGEWIITSRLPVASPILQNASIAYKLEQA